MAVDGKARALDRRSFLRASALVAASAPAGALAMNPDEQKAWDMYGAAVVQRPEGLLASEPMLQAPAPCSMGVAFSVNARSAGFAEVAENPEMKHAVRFESAGIPIAHADDRIHTIRMTGLKPGTRYWYRVGAAKLVHPVGYWTKPSETVWGQVHSFTTPGEGAPSHFAMMSDTHAAFAQMAKITAKYRASAVPFVVWNGDIAASKLDCREDLVRHFLEVPENAGYAADTPIVFNSGNHDFRGDYATRLEEAVMARPDDELASRHPALRRNYAFRAGQIALIGLDTGEDKPDHHPAFGGLARYSPYRKAQAEWLKEQFRRPEIASAPFVVAFVHIPLFDSRPGANPGNILEDWADWQEEGSLLWGPTLAENAVQLVVAGHKHRYRFDPATEGRPWAQIVGGGKGGATFQTLVEGIVEGGELAVKVWNTDSGELVAVHKFKPRAR